MTKKEKMLLGAMGELQHLTGIIKGDIHNDVSRDPLFFTKLINNCERAFSIACEARNAYSAQECDRAEKFFKKEKR